MGVYVAIGLTTDSLLKDKKHYNQIQSYEVRKKKLEIFIEKDLKKAKDFYSIIPLNDPLGPVVTESGLEALICSHETYRGCININKIRIKNGLAPTVIIIIPLIQNSTGRKLSSTDIRAELLHIEVDC